MHIKKDDIPKRIDIPGAVARQVIGFGDASKYSGFAGEYFSLKEGTDITPLLKGLVPYPRSFFTSIGNLKYQAAITIV